MSMLKKSILKVILFLSIFSILHANEIDDIKSNFNSLTTTIIKIVKNKNLSQEDRNNKIVQTITPIFDFKLMAKLSLGRKWKTMDKEKQNKFTNLYVQRMKNSYSSKIDKYTDEKIIINNIKQVKRNRVKLNTSLVGTEDKLEVIYKYYKPRKKIRNKNLWVVYDVVISGVSIIKTDKAQFKAVLEESSINDLMARLKK